MPNHKVEEADYWRDLEEHSHLPQVQEIIREEILRGTIRVRPDANGGVLIIPVQARPGPKGNDSPFT